MGVEELQGGFGLKIGAGRGGMIILENLGGVVRKYVKFWCYQCQFRGEHLISVDHFLAGTKIQSAF